MVWFFRVTYVHLITGTYVRTIKTFREWVFRKLRTYVLWNQFIRSTLLNLFLDANSLIDPYLYDVFGNEYNKLPAVCPIYVTFVIVGLLLTTRTCFWDQLTIVSVPVPVPVPFIVPYDSTIIKSSKVFFDTIPYSSVFNTVLGVFYYWLSHYRTVRYRSVYLSSRDLELINSAHFCPRVHWKRKISN